MPCASYEFRTSNFNWRMGITALVPAAFFLGMRAYTHSASMVPVGIAAFFALLSIPCFLGRYSLLLDLQSGHIKDTSGFWPFVRTRYEWIADFAGLEITVVVGSRSGATYTLWLLAKDGRRISLADSGAWPRINDRAQELSQATGWTVNDRTDGRNSLSALLRG